MDTNELNDEKRSLIISMLAILEDRESTYSERDSAVALLGDAVNVSRLVGHDDAEVIFLARKWLRDDRARNAY